MVNFYNAGGGNGIPFQPTYHNPSVNAPISACAPTFISNRTKWLDNDQFNPSAKDFISTFESLLPSSSSAVGSTPAPKRLEQRTLAFILRIKKRVHRILQHLSF
jgi:hypothetical protein